MAEINGKWLKSGSVNEGKILITDQGWIISNGGGGQNMIRTNAGKLEMGTAPVWGTAPASNDELANKAYVDAAVFGMRDMKDACRLATVAALPACTPAGGGVGKTLTGDANGALSVDGIAVAAGDRIMVKEQVAAADNGIYVVTQAGDGSNPFILTRSTDADEDAEVTQGTSAIILFGSQAQSIFAVSTADPITVDTTALTFVEIPNPANQYSPKKQEHTVSGETATQAYNITLLGGEPKANSLQVRIVDGPILSEAQAEFSFLGTTLTIAGSLIGGTKIVTGDKIEIMYGN